MVSSTRYPFMVSATTVSSPFAAFQMIWRRSFVGSALAGRGYSHTFSMGRPELVVVAILDERCRVNCVCRIKAPRNVFNITQARCSTLFSISSVPDHLK